MAAFKVGDRVRVAFPCPTAPPVHREYEGLTGTVEEVRPYVPTIKNVYGQDIPNPSGNITVRFDPGPLPGGHHPYRLSGAGSFAVGYVFSWELDPV